MITNNRNKKWIKVNRVKTNNKITSSKTNNNKI